MASTITAGIGRRVRSVPRAALALPRGLNPRRIVLALLVALALAAGYWFWFRDSSLVAIDEVEVSGVTYAEEEIGAALTAAAQEMTTLNADVAELERAVEAYPTVASVAIDPGFPHKLAIEVTERAPVASIGAGKGIAVAGDGTVLGHLGENTENLPPIETSKPPSSGRLGGAALAQAEILGAAPDPLRPAIDATELDKEQGVVVVLGEGIELRFGDSSNAAAKWSAAAAVLADPKLDEIDYVDVRLPGRPAVGGAPLPEPTEPEETVGPPPAESLATDPAAVDPAATTAPATEVAAPAVPAEGASPDPATPPPASGVAGGAAAP